MIGKRALKVYGWTQIEQYFDYIVESKINGNHQQVRDLVKDLSKSQKRLLCNYLEGNEGLGISESDKNFITECVQWL